ncbi:hypothetical protein [Sediminitomix flava]|uniref:NlpE-like protein n=1 Tax=Sediminitomix flava TaxID=379075 RepID=A0A315ZAD1_SEDFL|nr:hypothetical protein [Sediminitomix flava]PWJ42545.1 hypothetical protein BC781_10288 [Sediminitomix flava]
MKKLLYLLLSIFIFASCQNDSKLSLMNNIDGIYIGTYQSKKENSEISLTLKDGSFTENSIQRSELSTSRGEFRLNKNQMEFHVHSYLSNNESNPKLALEGAWKAELRKGKLVLSNEQGEKYKLYKQIQ